MIAKQQCKDKGWDNPKEITNKEIAHCIVEYGCKKEIPESRREGVEREITKLRNQREREHIRQEIEGILWEPKYKLRPDYDQRQANWLWIPFEETGEGDYIFDPGYFTTPEQAVIAKDWCEYLTSDIRFIDKTFRDSKHHAQKVKRLKSKILECYDEYIALGGDEETAKRMLQLPRPELPSARKFFSEYKNSIIKDLTMAGVSKTNAEKVAAQIVSTAIRSHTPNNK